MLVVETQRVTTFVMNLIAFWNWPVEILVDNAMSIAYTIPHVAFA